MDEDILYSILVTVLYSAFYHNYQIVMHQAARLFDTVSGFVRLGACDYEGTE